MIDPIDLGKRILERLKQQGLTQEQLGHALCVSAQAVSKWENGESLPDIGMLPSLCKVLGISADALLGIDSELGVETLATKLAQCIGRLKTREERNTALIATLGFLNPAHDIGWNQDRNISYDLHDNRLVGLSFWSRSGLMCFVRGDALEEEEPSSDMMDVICTLVRPECWNVAHHLLDGPKRTDALLEAGAGASAKSLLDLLGELIDAGILVQDREGYRLEENHGLLLTGVLKALCREAMKTDVGEGIHMNRTP